MTFTKGAEHDRELLVRAREFLECACGADVVNRVRQLVARNEAWRGRACINLIAAESPTSPSARRLLSSELGIRGSGGHIGEQNRSFAGMQHADELEALCIELLKELFSARHADHRPLGGMAACVVAYASLADHGDTVMSIPPRFGGDSSGRQDGPPGVLGLRVVDLPFAEDGLGVEMNEFRRLAERHRPRVVSLNQALTLFPLPVREISEFVAEWGGRVYFDGAHQAGLIAGGCYPNPLEQGATVLTGSAGKTFSGPQGGILAWNDDALAPEITKRIFPMLTGSHQLNRVAAMAVAAAEMREFGRQYMGQTIRNARALGAALRDEGVNVIGAASGCTQTHQVLVDVRGHGTGFQVARRLEEANIVVNRMLLPTDSDDAEAEPSGIRLGTTEVTRLGMGTGEMRSIARWMARIVIEREPPAAVRHEVEQFREAFQTIHYCFDPGT